MLNLSILTIGDEICIGQIINTNAAWIAAECTRISCKILAHSSIGDEMDSIISEIGRLIAHSDALIITGGLGPTHDDITKEAIRAFLGDTIVLHEPTLAYLKEFYTSRNRTLIERNATQALLPSTAQPLHNSRGTAPGMLFDYHGKMIVSLPGVPMEMKGIMTDHVLPLLAKRAAIGDVLLYKTLMTTGIPEASLADLIGEPSEFLHGASLAFLPSYQGVRLRIGVSAATNIAAEAEIERIETHIRSKAAKFIFGEDNQSLTTVVTNLLLEKKLTVSVAESCTGGLLGAALTDLAGSSAYFEGGVQTYSYAAKEHILSVKHETLTTYGAVSSETVEEMAVNVRQKFSTDFGISISGIAGPGGGLPEKPVGTVWIGLAHPSGVITKRFNFGNDRTMNRERSVGAALEMLYRALIG